jgi:CRP-like cAMP-binding protein
MLMESMEAIYKNEDMANFKFIIDNFADFDGFFKQEDWLLMTASRLDKYFRKGSFIFLKVATIIAGRCFAELALINNDPRAASAYANREVVALTLNKQNFKKIFAANIAAEAEKMNFFQLMFPQLDKGLMIKFLY